MSVAAAPAHAAAAIPGRISGILATRNTSTAVHWAPSRSVPACGSISTSISGTSAGASAWYDQWLPALEVLRGEYAWVVGARAEDLSLHPSLSSALGVVAESLDYRDRPRVVVTSLDFPTVAYQWIAKQQEGVEVVVVESPDGTSCPPRIAGAGDR